VVVVVKPTMAVVVLRVVQEAVVEDPVVVQELVVALA
jgi:hypothetical protein